MQNPRAAAENVGLNYIDVYQRNGNYQLNLPSSLGMEGVLTVPDLGKSNVVEQEQPVLETTEPAEEGTQPDLETTTPPDIEELPIIGEEDLEVVDEQDLE